MDYAIYYWRVHCRNADDNLQLLRATCALFDDRSTPAILSRWFKATTRWAFGDLPKPSGLGAASYLGFEAVGTRIDKEGM